MMPSTLISVALCTYNGEKYIEEQLHSILNQTYQNLEIIIVDDCSTDNTWAIIKSYATKDTRIKYFKNNENIGFNKNFEKAISLTSGDFIALSDQDDIWKPFKLELLLKNIDDNWLIFSNSSYINENGDPANKDLLQNFSLIQKSYKSILLHNWVTGHTTLFTRKLLNYIMPFPESGFYDWWIGFVAIYHHKITYLDKVLTFYRAHTNSVIQKELQMSYRKYKKYQLNSTIMMLTAFINYKNVVDLDKNFISNLLNALLFKKRYLIIIPLLSMIYSNYNEFYSDRKKREGLSKLNFAYKIAKSI
ncbi:MAG: glycosyltransferase family 2 protein [Janthinobacterium lividum]